MAQPQLTWEDLGVCAALEAGLGAHPAPSDLPVLSLLPHLSQGMAIFAVVGGSQRLP